MSDQWVCFEAGIGTADTFSGVVVVFMGAAVAIAEAVIALVGIG